jgi:hypothetical protein
MADSVRSTGIQSRGVPRLALLPCLALTFLFGLPACCCISAFGNSATRGPELQPPGDPHRRPSAVLLAAFATIPIASETWSLDRLIVAWCW